MAFRPCLLAVAMLPSIVACGGDEEGNVIPEGPVYKYVASKVLVPTSSAQAREYGLDLNGDKTVDNQLGAVLSTLAGQGGFDIQATLDKAVATGDILLLMDFQTRDFMNTTAAGVRVLLGDTDTIMPSACAPGEMYNETTNTGCGKHLTGTGTFTVKATPQEVALGGKIINGTFTGGPGDLTLQIALGGTEAIDLNLIGARAKGSGLSETMLGTGTSGGIVFGGAITKTDIDEKVIPAIQTQLEPVIAEDCIMPTMPPGCGCMADSTGKTILDLFDEDNDCAVSVLEITTNSLIVSLLAPDVKINGKDALSIGIKAHAVAATY